MKKRRIYRTALVLTLVLTLAFTLAACGKKTQDKADGSKKYVIGFNTWGSGSPTFDVMGDEIAYTIGVYGMEGSRVSDDFTPDKTLQNVQNFISAEVDGLVMQITAPPVLPQAAEVCLNAKMPFVMGIFCGLPDARAQISANNAYYIGAVEANVYEDGYLMGKAAAADGHKTALLIGGNVGDYHFEQRIAGFTKAFCDEGGGVIVDEARCSSPAESQEKASALLSANRDADCIYAMVGDYVTGPINAMDMLGLTGMALYVSNGGLDTANYIKEGRVAACGGGNDLASGIATALLINYLDGHAILDGNGKAPELEIIPFLVTKSNVDSYISLFFAQGAHPMAPALLKTLIWRENNEVNYKTFTDLLANSLTIEALQAAYK
jgi:ABC-type sugar transport system substrate-binding protein